MLPVNPQFYENKRKKRLPQINIAESLRTVEQASILSVPEKVNIVAMVLGYKWITDVAIDSEESFAGAESLLDQLGLSYTRNRYTHKDETHKWIQVAATQAILDYVIERRDELTVLEAGVLYGYPISHSLGYVGLIEKEWKNDKSIAEFYLSGVYSRAYSTRESQYFEKVWAEITQASPEIARQAQMFYDKS